MLHDYWLTFWQLIRAPFHHSELIWGIVPIYFGWLLNELTSSKASFRTAIQTGFSFLWAGAHWSYQYFARGAEFNLNRLFAVNVLVTVFVLSIGLAALASGLRRKYPKYCSFLGHTRFSNYFMIAIYPIQSAHLTHLSWTWDRLAAILVFAFPTWIILHFGLMPLRK